MQLLMIVMLMALSVALSITLEQIFSKISVNYISIAMGMLIEGGFILSNHINYGEFPSELFLGIIVTPLLFFEGQATHLNLVAHKMKDIIQITVVMVLICLVIAGFGVNFITGVSLPLAFVLAAISTPTDATATESVTNGLKIPKKEGTLLKMESLFNDASGIILLNMAMLWYLNGQIAYGITLKNFVVSSVGGAMFGLTIKRAQTSDFNQGFAPAKLTYLFFTIVTFKLSSHGFSILRFNIFFYNFLTHIA